MTTKNFLPEQEIMLIEKFLRSSPRTPNYLITQRCELKCFSIRYRDLAFGSSFLNEPNSCRWLTTWRDYCFAKNNSIKYMSEILGHVCEWTNFLFSRDVIDGNAFFYLKPLAFLQRRQYPPHLTRNLQNSIREYGFQIEQDYQPATVRIYLGYLHDFNLFQNAWTHYNYDGNCMQDKSLILGWIKNLSQRLDERNLGTAIRVLGNFMEFLRKQGFLEVNAVENLYKDHPLHGWRGLAMVGQSSYPTIALESLRPMPRFTSAWGDIMVDFLHLKRKLGALYATEERILANLDRFLLKAGVVQKQNLQPILIHKWLEGQIGNNSQTLRTKRSVAERFFEHARSLGFISENPAKSNSRKQPRRTLRPFIFSTEQIKMILEKSANLQETTSFLHRGPTYEMIFATLYSLGLRISEVCNLCISDIDLGKGLLLIRETKFFKSRLLPFGPNYRNRLTKFVGLRQIRQTGKQEDAPLFTARHGKPINRNTVGVFFRRITREMDFKVSPWQRPPCLHSFRHSFAVHRLIRWYREGDDVQAKLPYLSAFMGHIDIKSTQVYLQETTELMEVANIKFESRFGNHFLNGGQTDEEN